MIHQMVAHVSGLGEESRIRHDLASDQRKPGMVQPDGVVHVVNTDPLESETARCTPAEFAGRFGFKLPEPVAQTPPGRATGLPTNDCEVTSLALAGMMLAGMLLVENFLANRTAA